MEQTVYADLLFLINFSMDFLCLFLVTKLSAKRISLVRLGLSATLGGLYSVAALFLTLGGWRLAVDISVCLIMCILAFFERREGLSRILFYAAAFFLSSMLLGGIMTAIFNLMNQASPPLDAFPKSQGIPLWLFALVTAAATGITWIGGRFLRRRAQIPVVQLEIRLGKRQAVMSAMCDSGNLLRDSISGKPIIIADTKNAVNLLPANCKSVSEWDAETLAALPTSISSRIRLIPTNTVHAGGILYALRPDRITLRIGNRSRTADALIGFADLRSTLHGCSAIIPPELLT